MSDAQHMAEAPATGSRAPEAKVWAALGGTSAGGIVTAAILYALGQYGFHGAVPPQIAALVGLVVTDVLMFLPAYYAPHTPRPDLTTAAGPPRLAIPPPEES